MAESERPDDEREPPEAAADTPPEAAADDTPPEAEQEAPADGLSQALEAAAEEVPGADAGPGKGVMPDPATAGPPPPSPDEAPSQPAAEDAVPGAHLEPDLVLDEARGESETPYAEGADDAPPSGDGEREREGEEQPAPIAATPMDLAADARYRATGKRKSSVARVILRPGSGTYTINGRPLEAFFPRPTLQKRVQQPLETAGYETRMDVIAKIHGGGVSGQAGALRHGVARALVGADPNLRQELKRRGFLTRDARVKERKKAGLKKARKRPQFSKR